VCAGKSIILVTLCLIMSSNIPITSSLFETMVSVIWNRLIHVTEEIGPSLSLTFEQAIVNNFPFECFSGSG